MAKNKLKKFDDIAQFSNVTEHTPMNKEPFPYKGKWREKVFKNDNPIVLELACGKGEYSVGLAQLDKTRNYIGIDIKGSRIWQGANIALESGLNNVHFLRTYIDHLEQFFEKGEVNEIWIIFPDPFLRDRDSKKRLTSEKFLNIYRNICSPATTINLKTDSTELFEFTKEVIADEQLQILDVVDNVYEERPNDPVLTQIQTFYEHMHLLDHRSIHFISYQLYNK